MKNRHLLCVLGLGISLLVTPAVQAKKPAATEQRPFDYYLLSLSWSPEFCATRPNDRQCDRQYSFVLHGLWPQYTKGYPQSCSNEKTDMALLRQFSDLYPSDKLAVHEWQKHGTCSGLTQQGYLELSQQLKNKFTIPKELENLEKPLRVSKEQLVDLIKAANPNISEESVALSCTGKGRFLREVYICYDKTGNQSATCGADVQKRSRSSCGKASFLIRNIR